MSVFLTYDSNKTFEADRDPTSSDYLITIQDESQIVPLPNNLWRNTVTNELFQCTSVDPGVSISWSQKASISTNSFTPSLEFAGAFTGITYSSQVGNYVKVGNAVSFNIYIALTNKGSSTGDATITGLPFANGSTPAAFTCYFQDCGMSLSYSGYGARIAPSQDFIRLFEHGSLLTLQNLTDSLFQNNTQFFISGTYFS